MPKQRGCESARALATRNQLVLDWIVSIFSLANHGWQQCSAVLTRLAGSRRSRTPTNTSSGFGPVLRRSVCFVTAVVAVIVAAVALGSPAASAEDLGAPVLTSQPDPATVWVGNPAIFTVAASGNPTRVQWQVSTDSASSWSDIPAAQETSYTFTPTSRDDGNEYRVQVANAAGATTSLPALLTVTGWIEFTQQPPSQTTVVAGHTVTLSSAAIGNPAPTTIQWWRSRSMFDDLNTPDPSPIPGATGSSYTFTAAPNLDGVVFWVEYTTPDGNSSAFSDPSTVLVQYAPIVDEQPPPQTVPGQRYCVSAYGNPTPEMTQQLSGDGGVTWNTVLVTHASGSFRTGVCYAEPTPHGPVAGRQYRWVFTNSIGTTISTVTTVVTAPPRVTAQPESQTAVSGQSITFAAAADGYPTATQWQRSNDGGTNWNDIPGATTATYTLQPTPADNGTQYRTMFTNAAGASGTEPATLTVTYAPNITRQPRTLLVAPGQNATLTASADASPAATVHWQRSSDGGASWTDVAGAVTGNYTVAVTPADDNTQYRAVFTNSVGSVASSVATISLQCPPMLSTQPADIYAVAGGTATFTSVASCHPTPTQQWQQSHRWRDQLD